MDPINQNNESTLFVVDCSPSMNTPRNGRVPLLQVFHHLEKIFLNKMHHYTNDCVGILLYNTDHVDQDTNKHVSMMYSLNYPSPKLINHLNDMSTGWVSFDETYGAIRDGVPLEQVLWIAIGAFSRGIGQIGRKKIVLITNQDDPCSPEEKRATLDCIESLNQSDANHAEPTRSEDNADIEYPKDQIKLLVCGIDRPDHVFDYSLFYEGFGDSGMPEDKLSKDLPQSPSSILKRLLPIDNLGKGSNPSTFRVPFQLTKGVVIGISGMPVARRQQKPPFLWAAKKEGGLQPLDRVTFYKDEDTDQNLRQDVLSSAFEYGGFKIPLSQSDMKAIEDIGKPGIVVLGFKPRKCLLAHHTIGRPYLIVPDESSYKGSADVLKTLHTTLKNTDKICYCLWTFGSKRAPRIMVLIPQESPFGFSGILLPYTDDIRALPIKSTPRVSQNLVESAKRLVEHRKPNDDVWGYPNPVLERNRRLVDAMGLERDVQEVIDQPLTEPIDRTLDPLISQFKAEISRNA
ncbi:SPOC like C-terminal domain-containing protein [Phycomyces nitens]|nr:SPOC like C-terminal domain-containing protein [Phycomyces nitens]